MKRILLVFTLLFVGIFATSCFFESVTSIRIKSGFRSSLELDEVVDLHGISIEVVVDGKVTETVYGDTDGVEITGLDTSTSGDKIATVSYQNVSVNVSYSVVGADSKASTITTLSALLKADTPIITLQNGVYDFSLLTAENQKIQRSVVIRASVGSNVVLKNVVIEIPANASASTVEFRNVKFESGDTETILVAKTLRATTDETPTNNFDKLIIKNSEIIAIGKATGISLDGKTNFEMRDSKWTTPTDDDYFSYLMNTSSSKKLNNTLLIEDNEFKCNFWYGLGQISNAVIRGNLFESTLKNDTHLKDSEYAPLYNFGKNPVIFHASTPSSGPLAGQLNLTVTGNTFKNAENLFRIYQTDRNSENAADDLIVSNNTINNVNFLVNYSSTAYTKDFLTIVKNGVTGTSASTTAKYVASQNTTILPNNDERKLTVVGEDFIYQGFEYQHKDTIDLENRYYYVGRVDGKHTLAKKVGTEIRFFTMDIKYSSDGKDTRTITLITDQDLLGKLEGYYSLTHFVVE